MEIFGRQHWRPWHLVWRLYLWVIRLVQSVGTECWRSWTPCSRTSGITVGFEQEHDTIMDWAAVWIHLIDMAARLGDLLLDYCSKPTQFTLFLTHQSRTCCMLAQASLSLLRTAEGHDLLTLQAETIIWHRGKSPADTSGELWLYPAGRWSKALRGEQPALRNRYNLTAV